MEWKDVEGYEGLYLVSDEGEVKSMHKQPRVLKPRETHLGYMQVCLMKGGESKWVYVHRLVAEAFCSNPYRLTVVNHINCNRKDNRASNIEWCTQSQNVRHNFCQVRKVISRRTSYKEYSNKVTPRTSDGGESLF